DISNGLFFVTMLGEGVAGGGKQQKNGTVDGKNSKALGDIGNLDLVKGVEIKPNRPIIRSFYAQLLANAQAVAATENNKVNTQYNSLIHFFLIVAPKPVEKKVTAKPKPQEVIEINPVKEAQKNKSVNKKKKEGGENKKKSQTFTSVLTSRSKQLWFSIANNMWFDQKPKEQVIDIDAGDTSNELAVVEYIEDIYKFYKLVEIYHTFYVKWIYLLKSNDDTFFYSSNDFVCLSDSAFTHEQILVVEKIILGKLEWTLTMPTPYVFLVRFIKASVSDQDMENMAHFLSELGMMHYETLMYCPSMVAASAVFAARCTLNKTPIWNETLKLHTGYSEEQLIDCDKLLASFHSTIGDEKHKVLYRKHSDPQRGAVDVLSRAKNLI
ncbi:hypothetical protein Lal_00000974, partial [Lupinus albus]